MVHYDPRDPRWVSDPGPVFDDLREQNPVHFAPGGYWVVTRHADCLAVLRSPLASSDATNTDDDRLPKGSRSAAQREELRRIRESGQNNRAFLFRDPPDHTRLRGLVQRAFTPRRVAELAPFITQRTREVLARHLNGPSFDAVRELAWSIPVAVICEMLAIPADDHERFEEHSAMLARGLDPEFLLSDEEIRLRDEAITFFALYFYELFQQRRANPGDDLLSALVAARDGSDRLSEEELLTTAILLLVAGHETTMNLISGSLLHLARDARLQEELRAHPERDRSATDEFLRLVSPVQLTGRSLLGDLTVGDQILEKGSFVFVLLGAANRDPAVFADPTRLNIVRDPNPHLGFGFGLHHCLGAPLARLESSIVIREVLNATSSVTLDAEQVRYRPNIILRGLESLPLTLRS